MKTEELLERMYREKNKFYDVPTFGGMASDTVYFEYTLSVEGDPEITGESDSGMEGLAHFFLDAKNGPREVESITIKQKNGKETTFKFLRAAG